MALFSRHTPEKSVEPGTSVNRREKMTNNKWIIAMETKYAEGLATSAPRQ